MADTKPTHRRTLSGKRIPIDTPRPRTWHELVAASKAPKKETVK